MSPELIAAFGTYGPTGVIVLAVILVVYRAMDKRYSVTVTIGPKDSSNRSAVKGR
jgi:hypothetical protein